MQSTLRSEAVFRGTGVHSGRAATVVVSPASADYGIWFKRVDLRGSDNLIPASYDAVTDTRLCTKIENQAGATVSTIEHLMAALAGLGVDNALIEIDGPEIPIMDGSSKAFVAGMLRAGLRDLDGERRAIRILADVVVEDGSRRAALSPADALEIDFEIDFADAAIGRQQRRLELRNGAFIRDLSAARTFCSLSEVDALRGAGLLKGGSLDNAVVIDGRAVLNPGGLRYRDECVRHKMLDAVGDLALAGAPIIGLYQGRRAGHEMTNRLLRRLFATPGAWRYETADDAEATLPPSRAVGGVDLRLRA